MGVGALGVELRGKGGGTVEGTERHVAGDPLTVCTHRT